MANLNKENIITVDVKNATVKTQGSMTFYVTDIKTCNIFCQLVVNESNSDLIKKYAPVENAEDYQVTMRIIKPNNEPKELEFSLLNQLEAFFMVDLTEEYKDYAGQYKCELFIDSTVNGELERITTSSFTYTINKSIMSDLDDIIDGDPSQALVETFATKRYVDDSIAVIPETDLLSDFATLNTVDIMIQKQNDEITRQDFASREYVNSMITSVRNDIYEAGYTTESYVDEEISKLNTNINNLLMNSYATKSEMNIAINEALVDIDSIYATQEKTNELSKRITSAQSLATEANIRLDYIEEDYASKDYVDTAIANAQLGGEEGGVDLSDYATKDYVHEYVSNNGGSVDTDNLAITNSLTVGLDCTASGVGSVAHGVGCTARGDYSHAEGQATIASNIASHAEGMECYTYGDYSHAEGYWTITYSDYQHVQGRFNIFDENNKYAHIVGNGNGGDESNNWQPMRSNAHTLDWDGNAWYAKDVYVGGTSQDDANKLATESYVDNAINNIEIPDVDLTDYATKTYVSTYVNNMLGDIETLLGEI